MEMENSRRSAIDRSRDLSVLKKPRLSEFAQDRETNGVSSRVSSSNPRFRENEERDDSIRELVAQYKTALAELTFNSKPIITNLTIIAGENLHAAKGIAGTICNNVLEVPIEQKLPSLYLLDSIVKNIGRDYIKHFAARLPEVFCKAYKKVDSSILPGMRHLFGTWKRVFPPSALQIIEKELGFPPVVNGSSGTAASMSDSQSQRPAHSIHVNPKYLERQRLQQTRAKEIQSDESGDMATTTDDTEISDRPTITGSTRQWTDLSGKMPNIQQPQREPSADLGYEKKGIRDVKNHQFTCVLSRQPGQGGGRIESIKEQDELNKSYYGTDDTVLETLISRKKGFDDNQSYGNYRASGYGQADRPLPSVHANVTNKSVHPTSRNWKNSEEAEYTWDDMNSKSTEYGGTSNLLKGDWDVDNAEKRAGLQTDRWIPLGSGQPDFLQDKPDTFSRLKPSRGEDRVPSFMDTDDKYLYSHSQRDADSRRNTETSADPLSVRQAALAHQVLSMWPQHEPLLPAAGLNKKSPRFSGKPEGVAISLSSGSSIDLISPLPRPVLASRSHPSNFGPSGSSGLYGHQRQQPLQPPSPPSHSLQSFQSSQHQKLHNAVNHDLPQPQFSQLGQKPIQLPGHLNRAGHASPTQDSPPRFAPNQSLLRHNPPLLHQAQSELPLQRAKTTQSQPTLSQSCETQLQRFSVDVSSTNSVDISGQSSTSDLLAAIMTSGLLPDIPTSSFQNFNIQPPLPTGPPPIQALLSSGPLVPPSSLPLQISQGNSPALTSGVVLPLHCRLVPPSSLPLQISQGNSPALTSGVVLPLHCRLVPPSSLPLQISQGNSPALTSGVVLPLHCRLVPPSSLPLQISQGNSPALTSGVVLPPLPPGPPPSSQKPNTSSVISDPFSSLLSSLVAKGIIASPSTEMLVLTSAQMPNKLPDQIIESSSSTMVKVPSNSDASTVPLSSEKEPFVSEPSTSTGVASLAPYAMGLEEDLIGIDFKPENIRELHPLVISSLFDDLKYQCGICGLRFKIQEQLESHADLHFSEKCLLHNSDELTRKWYSNKKNWVAGYIEPSEMPVEEVIPSSEKSEAMVPVDESQCICALCGEPFEDLYSHERDEWMYKGAVYLNSPEWVGDLGSMDKIKEQVLIVHAKCLSCSADNNNVTNNGGMLQQ